MQQSIIEVSQFSGLNVREAPGRIDDTELVDVLNFDLSRRGELTKRTGIASCGTIGGGGSPVTVIAFFQTNTVSQVIVKMGNNLYYTTNGSTYTLIGTYNNVEWGCQYNNVLYMVRRDD